MQLPASAILSDALVKHGNVAVASGGLTDCWKGCFGSTQVAIKAFRIYPAKDLKEAKEVRINFGNLGSPLRDKIYRFCGDGY